MNFFKIKNWEYWPAPMFYIPLLPYAFYLMLKSRSFGFFSAVNPGIEGSGNGLDSKFKTIELLPDYCKPKSIFISKFQNFEIIKNQLISTKIKYPLIIKPDIGFRGLLVKKIQNEKELYSYIYKYNSINLIIQEYIDFKNECGIFYYRLPSEKSGVITSLTLKKYLTVKGDGISTLEKLIKKDSRAQNYVSLVSEINKEKLHIILPKDEEIVLNVIGNHSKGTQFINGNHLINNKLLSVLNSLNIKIEGWYYGRIDIKYNSFEELLEGENFKILEINGIIAEPTHIYDATKGTYFMALTSLKKHWKIIYKIGIANKKLKRGKFTNFKYLLKFYLRYTKYLKKVADLSTS